jgi:hypothetical protein
LPNTKNVVPGILRSKSVWRNVAGFIPASLWAVLVIILSLTSPGFAAELRWTDLAGFDKIAHLLFYCVFALWVIYGFFRLPLRYPFAGLWTILICILFGVGMELLQGWMRVGRQFEYLDILANVLGVLIGYCIFKFFIKRRYYGSNEH